ncbi:hypothetical protein Tco_0368152 [Tanacetum coccineum]
MSFNKFPKVLGNQNVTFSTRTPNNLVIVGSPSVQVAEPRKNDDRDACFIEESSLKRKRVVGLASSNSKLKSKKRRQEAPKSVGSKGSIPPLTTSGSVPKGVPCLEVQRRLDGLTFKELDEFYDVQAFRLAMTSNMDSEGSQLVKDLRADGVRMLRDLDLLKSVARSSEDSRKEKEATLLATEASLCDELDALPAKLKLVKLERNIMVTKFLPLFLNDVLGLENSWKLEDIKDYEADAKKVYDEADNAFFHLEFPYVAFLAENFKMILDELKVMEPPNLSWDVVQALAMPLS